MEATVVLVVPVVLVELARIPAAGSALRVHVVLVVPVAEVRTAGAARTQRATWPINLA